MPVLLVATFLPQNIPAISFIVINHFPNFPGIHRVIDLISDAKIVVLLQLLKYFSNFF